LHATGGVAEVNLESLLAAKVDPKVIGDIEEERVELARRV
jgi:hypothetical protein